MPISTSFKHFLDTNVLLRHAANDSHPDCRDIGTILSEAFEGKRTLWVSSIIIAECRPSYFIPGNFSSLDEMLNYISRIAIVISPTPDILSRAARLRDARYTREPSMRDKEEKPCCLTLGDAIHLSSALWVKEYMDVNDLEFLTLDNRRDKSIETDPGTKSVPLLDFHKFTYGLGHNTDVKGVVELPRVKPLLENPKLIQ